MFDPENVWSLYELFDQLKLLVTDNDLEELFNIDVLKTLEITLMKTPEVLLYLWLKTLKQQYLLWRP